MISFEEARAKVIEILSARASAPEHEPIEIGKDPALALKRVLAENISADRNYPPFNRSIRDGFAVRCADTAQPGAKLHPIGESGAGVAFNGVLGEGQCVRIFTGAPVPKGANAVVMQEKTQQDGEFIVVEQTARAGEHYV